MPGMHDVQVRRADASLKIRMLSLEDINLQAVRFISSDAFERMLSDSHKNAMIHSRYILTLLLQYISVGFAVFTLWMHRANNSSPPFSSSLHIHPFPCSLLSSGREAIG